MLGTLLGILVAWRRGTWLDNLLPATTFFQAAPYFFVAFLAIDLFAIRLGWFPSRPRLQTSSTSRRWNWTYIGDVLDHAILPALTIVVALGRGLDRGHAQRDGHHDGRGLRPGRAGQGPAQAPGDLVRGAQRDPAQRVRLLAGHRLRGVRRAAHRDRVQLPGPRLHPAPGGAGARDYALLQGIFLVITFAVLVANLVADFVYVFLDPRTRQEA